MSISRKNPKRADVKRILSLIIAAIMCLSVMVSCSTRNDGNGGDTTEVKNPSSSLSMWIEHGFDKIRTEIRAPSNPKTEHDVYLAKNDVEGFHIALRSDSAMSSLTLRVLSGDNDHISFEFFEVKPILTIGRKQYTDPCVPIGQGTRLSLNKNKTKAIYIDFETTADTPAGEYTYEFGVMDKSRNVLSTVKVTVHVWDFEMPEERKFITAAGLSYKDGKTSVEHYEMLLDYGLSAYHLPYDILDDEANDYMSDPRVTSFCVLFLSDDIDDATLIARYNKLKTNPVWLAKAYFYPMDEPDTVEELYQLRERCKHLREICPDIKIMVPYFTDIEMPDGTDQIEFMDEYVDLHCPKLANWNDNYIYGGENYTGNNATNPYYNGTAYDKYGSFAERMEAIQAKGKTVVGYICNLPEQPYLNVKVDEDGMNHRIVVWQMYQRGIEGLFYCHTTCWTDDPWGDVDYFGQGWYGDGILTYPGDEVGRAGELVPSIRLIILRDGIQDVELLYMAEELLGIEWVEQRADKVSKSLTSVDVTSDELANIRIEIGNAIEQTLKNK